jgi:predicted esterase YcpF (UPF0227 family)
MTTTHLLYLHGFRSSPRSTKAQRMAAHVAQCWPGVQWVCPALPVSPRAAMAEVAALCADWPAATSVVMGSSLGGFYATAWAQQSGCRAVLLNPAVHPQLHGDVLVGRFPMWHDPSTTMNFEAAYLDELAAIEAWPLRHPQRLLTIVARGDEVLDAALLERHYAQTQLHAFDGGDHALSDFEAWLPVIDAFMAAECPP